MLWNRLLQVLSSPHSLGNLLGQLGELFVVVVVAGVRSGQIDGAVGHYAMQGVRVADMLLAENAPGSP